MGPADPHATAHRHPFANQVRPLLISAGVTFLAGAIGATLSQLLAGMLGFLPQQLLITLCTSFSFGVAATLFKAQDE